MPISGSMDRVRLWVITGIGAAVIAGAVLFVSERQRSTTDTNFAEASAAGSMQIGVLSGERGLDLFLASEQQSGLQVVYAAETELRKGLADATRLSRDDRTEARTVAAQAAAFRRWDELAHTAIRRREAVDRADTPLAERQRGRVIDRFIDQNERYQQRLLVNRHREERAAALLPVWVLLGLGAFVLVAIAGVSVAQRRRLRETEAFEQAQRTFGEAIQFADNETEAHQLLADHLEHVLPGSDVLVLKRNNSFDRLEPSRELPIDDSRREPLAQARPRTCLAVRLSRRYDRQPAGGHEVFGCAICGSLSGPSSCQPLLVGGEVIGSVLASHRSALDEQAEHHLEETVRQAAPVLANLRNLAIAESQAATDALTGLPNRRTLDDTLRQMLARASRTLSPLSVVLLDLDHFKQINDTYGHERGDDALAAVAAMLRATVREADFVGRRGGEEFLILLPDTDQTGAVPLADKLRRQMHHIQLAGLEQTITGSFGIATYPDDGTTTEALLRLADRALYTAKAAGRDRVEPSSPAGQRSTVVNQA
jgi:diguanylate cyclase (GGDEF)-like protein